MLCCATEFASFLVMLCQNQLPDLDIKRYQKADLLAELRCNMIIDCMC